MGRDYCRFARSRNRVVALVGWHSLMILIAVLLVQAITMVFMGLFK